MERETAESHIAVFNLFGMGILHLFMEFDNPASLVREYIHQKFLWGTVKSNGHKDT